MARKLMILVSDAITALSQSNVDLLVRKPLALSICRQKPQITETKYRLNWIQMEYRGRLKYAIGKTSTCERLLFLRLSSDPKLSVFKTCRECLCGDLGCLYSKEMHSATSTVKGSDASREGKIRYRWDTCWRLRTRDNAVFCWALHLRWRQLQYRHIWKKCCKENMPRRRN
jgi:hypothetical protein